MNFGPTGSIQTTFKVYSGNQILKPTDSVYTTVNVFPGRSIIEKSSLKFGYQRCDVYDVKYCNPKEFPLNFLTSDTQPNIQKTENVDIPSLQTGNVVFTNPEVPISNNVNIIIESTGEYINSGGWVDSPPVSFSGPNFQKNDFLGVKVEDTVYCNTADKVVIKNSETNEIETKEFNGQTSLSLNPGKYIVMVSRNYNSCAYEVRLGEETTSPSSDEKSYPSSQSPITESIKATISNVRISFEGSEEQFFEIEISEQPVPATTTPTTTTTQTPVFSTVTEVCKVDSDCGAEGSYCIDVDGDGVSECVDSQGNKFPSNTITGSFVLAINNIINSLIRLLGIG